MPPPTKRQRTDSAGSRALHEEDNRKSCSAAGQTKAGGNKRPRKDSADSSLLKAEWCELSKTAQRRHIRNEILSGIGAMIPGPGKLSENSLMLQAAARIKELEIEIERANNYLEKLKLQGSKGSPDNNLADQSADNNLTDQSVAAAVPAIQGTDGSEAIRAVLPQRTKAKGKKLLQYAWEYLSELGQELRQAGQQIAEHKKPETSPDSEK